MSITRVARATSIIAIGLLAQACAPGNYAIKAPASSGLPVQGSGAATGTLTVVDSRPADQKEFLTGVLSAKLLLDTKPIDPPAFVAQQLKAELASRGVKWDVVQGADGAPKLDLRNFRMVNQRVTGFSPFVTFTYLGADLVLDGKTHRVASFVTRAKVPVWSFSEVIDPTLNDPLSIAVKELAAKVLRAMNFKSSDQTVDELAAKLATRNDRSFMDVYALGFTNNPRAIDKVAALTGDPDDHVRMAAITSLGMLRATGKFGELKAIADQSAGDSLKFRATALHAIGDLGTPEAKAYLQQVSGGDVERAVVELYR